MPFRNRTFAKRLWGGLGTQSRRYAAWTGPQDPRVPTLGEVWWQGGALRETAGTAETKKGLQVGLRGRSQSGGFIRETRL